MFEYDYRLENEIDFWINILFLELEILWVIWSVDVIGCPLDP